MEDCLQSWPAFLPACFISASSDFCVLGADGAHSSIIDLAKFDVKVLQGGEAIGITCNFKNSKTKGMSRNQ